VVVVYGDAFARWDHTRWQVEVDYRPPRSMVLQTRRNREAQTDAVTLSATILCEQQAELDVRHVEALCAIEAAHLQIAAHTGPADAIRTEYEQLLVGASLQLQVDDAGRVLNVDLEGIPTDTRRSRTIAEILRQLLSHAMAGFDLALEHPNTLPTGTWLETSSRLIPISLDSIHASEVIHVARAEGDEVVVHSTGRGTAQPRKNMATVRGATAVRATLVGESRFDASRGFQTSRTFAVKYEELGSNERGHLTGSLQLVDAP
jgi:hypothetical protein